MGAIEDRFPLPVAPGRYVVGFLECRGVGAKPLVDLGLGPDVELPFHAFAVGIQGAGERERAVFGGTHFA